MHSIIINNSIDNPKMDMVSSPSDIADYDIDVSNNGHFTVSSSRNCVVQGNLQGNMDEIVEENIDGNLDKKTLKNTDDNSDIYVKKNMLGLFVISIYSILCKISNKLYHAPSISKIHDSSDNLVSVNINHQFIDEDSVHDAEKDVNLKIKNGKISNKNIDNEIYIVVQDIKNFRKLNHRQLELLKSFTKEELFDVLILFNETYENLSDILIAASALSSKMNIKPK